MPLLPGSAFISKGRHDLSNSVGDFANSAETPACFFITGVVGGGHGETAVTEQAVQGAQYPSNCSIRREGDIEAVSAEEQHGPTDGPV